MQDTTHERLQRKRIHEQKRDKKTQKKRRPPAGEKQIEREQRRKSKTGRKKKKQNTRTARESVEEAADAEKRDRRRNHKNREAHEKKKTKVRQERRRIEEKRREEKKQEYEKKRRGSKTKGKDTETKQVSTSYGENSKEVEKRRRRNRAERTQKTSQKQKETRKQARDTRQRPTHPRRKESRHANDTTEGDKARKEEEPRNKESKKRTKKEREHINEKDQESKRDTHGAKPPKTATQRIRSRAETANTRRRKQNTLNTEKRERQRRRREKKRKKKEEKKESFKTQEEGEVQKKTQPERRHRKRGEEEKNEQELNGALQRRVTKQEKLERAKPEKEKAARNRGEKRGRKDGAHNGTKREQSRQREEKHEENSNIIKEIRASTNVAIRNQGASIKSLELQIGQVSKVLQERGFGSLPGSTKTNLKDQVKSISTATTDLSEIRHMKHHPYTISIPQHRFIFPEIVPFPGRLHNQCCDFKDAHGVNILDAYDSKMPQKEKDPGSFTLPCLINNICFDKALVDLGASVSVMPLSTYTNLGLGELSHTRMTIELTDRTIKKPKGIASNVLVRIGKFVFPIDFVILDIPEDKDIPLILGRPFLLAKARIARTSSNHYAGPCLIMKSLVKKNQKGAISELKQRHLKKVSKLHQYAVSSKEDTAYLRQLITRTRIDQFPIRRIHCFSIRLYACSRFQVTPKTSHLHVVKRIFRYLKGKPKLGLWYPNVSSFNLEAYSDSDYAGANLDRKSTTRGCQFLGRRLISWQCKKQTIVATSTTEAEYVAAANCCGQVLWIQNQMLDYGFNFMNTNIYIDNESTICIVKNPVFHSKTKHIEIRHHFIRDAYEKKLIQVLKIHTDDNVADLLTKAFDFWNTASSQTVNDEKQIHATVNSKAVVITEASIRSSFLFNDADGTDCLTNEAIFQNLALMGYEGALNKLTFQKALFSPQWNYLIHTILDCLSSKSTSWNEFSTNIASAVICLTTNQKFNFSKLIFDGMLRNLDNPKKKFLMYPRFLMVFLNNQIELGEPFNDVYITPAHNLKVFSNMLRKGLKFSGKITPLFPNMLTQAVVDEGEVSEQPTEPQPTPSFTQPSTGDQPPLSKSLSRPEYTDSPSINLEGTGGSQGDQELFSICTNLSNRVLALETVKDAQAAEILKLRTRIKKLEKKCKPSISHHRAWLRSVSIKKKLRKKEYVSKQGRKKAKPGPTLDDSTLDDLDLDLDHSMDYIETEEAVDEGRLSKETKELKLTADTEEIAKDKGSGEKGGKVSAVEPRTPPATTSIFDDEDITMAQTLIKMKEEKAKEKGVPIKKVEESDRPARSILTLKPLPTIDPKDKGKGVLKESPVKKVKRSDLDAAQIAKDAEVARLEYEEELAELEREKEEKQRQEQASMDYIANLYDEVQAKMDASEELAARLQMEEREMYSVEERSRLLAEYFENRKKQLAAERSAAVRNKPPTRTQLRSLMMTYLKHTGRYKHAQLNKKTLEEIQVLYIKEQERIAYFVPIGLERDERMIEKLNKKAAGMDEKEALKEPNNTKVEENTRKRPGRRLKMKATKKSKRQKTDSDLEDEEQLKAFLKIVPDEEREIDYEVLDKRYPIINWESKFYHTDRYGEPHDYYRVFRSDGSSRWIKTFSEMVTRFDRMDLEELYNLVMKRFKTTTPEDDDLYKNQEEWILKSWNFYDNCGVHILMLEDGTEFYMLAERRYPLTKETLKRMLALRLIAESKSEAAFDLLRFIQKQIDESGSHDGICQKLYGSQLTMLHSKELASPKQTALALAIPEQTATGKETSNPFIAGRKAHFLGDKQLPSVGVFDEVTWMIFEGNTRDLGSILEETGQDCNFTRRGLKNFLQTMETASGFLVTLSEFASDGPSAPPTPKTAKQLATKRNRERVKSILLLAIPDEYLLKFRNVLDAKSLREVIKSRFGGNDESKKMQTNVLKHQFENFTTTPNESLDKDYDRFQKLISQMEVYAAPVSKEDINQKFLRSLPPSWSQIALIMRNKPDIDQTDIHDLYNNLRVYEDEIKSTARGTNQISSILCADEIDADDLKELDLRWQVAMLTIRVKKLFQKTGRNLDFKERQPVSFDKSKNKCYNCHRKWHFARECNSGRNQGKRPYGDNSRRNVPITESSSQALVAQDGLGGYDWSNDFDEPVNYALMAISSSSLSSSSETKVQNCSKQGLESFKTLQKNFDSEREKHNRARLEIQGYELALESLESRILGHEKNELLAWC
ncbi:putative ribonuclease H-like domain-containing protein [Tanacetum coccineum]|uniref:Ribonuclease H-like domain-containing protein n=1 Tax=Tanacetum coccineum TaxID=301880 RepID=A0ABQ5CY82_9ASTR